MKLKHIIIALLVLTSICSCASAAYLENGYLHVKDSIFGDSEYAYTEIIEYNGIVYAGGYAGFIAVDASTAEVIKHVPGAGSAGQVQTIVVSDKCLAIASEYNVAVYDNNNEYEPVLMYNINTYSDTPSIEIKRNTLYVDQYKYDISNIEQRRCTNPGAFIAIFDNEGTWAVESVGSGFADVIGFGWKGVEPIIGDWDGDGFKNVGIYNRAGNNFLIPDLNSPNDYKVIGLGWAGVTPVVGDFDGDGNDNVGVYDNKGTWALDTSSGVEIIGFGWEGTEPVVGDFDGDSIDEVGIYNRAGNNWLLRQDNGNPRVVGLGWEGVKTLVANVDSDKQDEVIVYDPTTSVFAIEGQKPFGYGVKNSQPITGDIDFNGISEVGCIYPDGSIHYNIAKYYQVELIKWPKSTAIAV